MLNQSLFNVSKLKKQNYMSFVNYILWHFPKYSVYILVCLSLL
jgi:hypothetical protein